jgi:uncharacterized damage-inducible protein DinB
LPLLYTDAPRLRDDADISLQRRNELSVNPYAYAAEGHDPLQVLAETPAKLEQLAARMSVEQMEVRPAPGKWNTREILAHLADCEIAFSFRLRQARAGATEIQPFDQDAWARTYAVYPAEVAVKTFAALRAWNMAFLSNLSEDEKHLPAHHPERGAMTLWTIVETMAGHDRHHLSKLEATPARR